MQHPREHPIPRVDAAWAKITANFSKRPLEIEVIRLLYSNGIKRY